MKAITLPYSSSYSYEEIKAGRTIFHWHCGKMMIRLIRWEINQQTGKKRRIGCRAWLCQKCGAKENYDGYC